MKVEARSYLEEECSRERKSPSTKPLAEAMLRVSRYSKEPSAAGTEWRRGKVEGSETREVVGI